MKLLAFETATEACSVAVYIDGDVRERFELAPHGTVIRAIIRDAQGNRLGGIPP